MCVVGEVGGGEAWPELGKEARRTEGGVARNGAAWGRVEVGRQRGKEEEALVINRTQSRRG